ncbi:trypsin-like serine protease with C-terminal PDZ domain [Firmicutes bacterium CAG:94]|nr:trypsin-like serine protease with C-terminal PDZ domain [Firmicutes bacterium CAG:94]
MELQTENGKKKVPLSTGLKWLRLVCMAVVFGIIAGGVMVGMNYLGGSMAAEEESIPQTSTVKVTAKAEDSDAVVAVAREAMPSVVTISTMSVEEMRSFFGGTQEIQVQGAGTGVIVNKNESELLIATNNHVVEGASQLSVGFVDQSSVEAQVKGTDVDNDLAVVAVQLSDIPAETLSQLKIATIGDSDELELGQPVVAIGNALGYGQSVTTGVVSALNRDLSLTDESGTAITSTGLIQTDAAINPGNSGGALLNMAGELIGINEAKTSSSGSGGSVDNIGFAIPIDKAEDSLKELMNLPTREKVDPSEASYLGIEGETITQDITQLYGIPTGVGVVAVEQGSPAEKAGIQQGDVITQFDGRAVANQQQLSDTLQYYKAGKTVDVTLQRADNGQYAGQTVSVTLGSAKEMPQESGASSTAESSDT